MVPDEEKQVIATGDARATTDTLQMCDRPVTRNRGACKRHATWRFTRPEFGGQVFYRCDKHAEVLDAQLAQLNYTYTRQRVA